MNRQEEPIDGAGSVADAATPPARAFWQRIETIHAVTYFAPESIAAAKEAGLRGFWMGYFGFRAAPLGPAAPGVVEAAFANFAPAMVRRAIPDAWSFADPSTLISARAASAAAALRRVVPTIEEVAAECIESMRALMVDEPALGRPLFAANREIDRFDDPVAELWQTCTVLREHRGDGHVMALATHEIDGVEAHHLLAAESGVDPDTFFSSRGWTTDEVEAGRSRLQARGFLDTSGRLTSRGADLRADIEQLTDVLARSGDAELLTRLDGVAREIVASGVLPFPNPMGLPALADQV